MSDLRVNGNLVLINPSSGQTVALGAQANGQVTPNGFTILLPTSVPQIGQFLMISSVFNGNTANAQWVFTDANKLLTIPRSANTVFAGPVSGVAALPTFRPFVAADLLNAVFGASGPSHSVGAVPDPGSVAGSTRFLCEDSTWAVPSTGATSFDTLTSGTNTAATMIVGPGSVLTFSGAGSPPTEGEVNANFLYGVQISGSAPTTGQVLTALSASSANWQTPSSGGGSGTVTTFSSGTLSPLFTTSVSNSTTTPALSFTLSNAAQNVVLAGPSVGGTGAPSYRALVAADIPSLSYVPLTSTTGNGFSDDSSTGISIAETGTGSIKIKQTGVGSIDIGTLAGEIDLDAHAGIILVDDSSNGITITENGTGGLITLSNSGTGGTAITDTGGGGITLQTGPTVGGVLSISQSGRFVFFNNSGSTGSPVALVDSSTAGMGVQLYSQTGSVSLVSNSASSPSMSLLNDGAGGTTIEDDGGGGILIQAAGGVNANFISLNNTGTGGTSIADTGGSGISIAASGGTANISLANATAHPILLPTTTGTSGYVLSTNGANPQQLSWIPASGGGIGGGIAANQIAFGTASNTIGGSSNFTWDDTNHILAGAGGYLDQVTGTTSIAFDNAVSAHGNATPHTTVTGTPSFPLEWALTVTVPTHPYIYDTAFQIVDDTNLLLIAAKPLTDTEPVTFDTGGSGFPWASIISFFRSTPNLAQVVGQTPGSTTWTFPYTTVAGDTICVALGGVSQNITAVSVTDTQGNTYVQEGYALQTGTAYVFLFVAQSTTPLVAGVDSITGVYTGGTSEDITLLELAPAGATLAFASNNVIVSTNSGLGGTHITDLGGGGIAISASNDNNYLSLSSSDVGGMLISDSGTTGMELSVSGTILATYPITSVDATDGVNTVYHGIFPVLNLAGVSITTTGFTNGVNNITANAVSSTRYTLVLPNASAVAEAAAATATNNLGGTLTLTNSSSGGINIVDSGSGGINVTGTGSGGVNITGSGSNFTQLVNLGSGGTNITDNGGGGINILDAATGGSHISIENSDTGGTVITDSGGGGILVQNTNTGSGETAIIDHGTTGIVIETQNTASNFTIQSGSAFPQGMTIEGGAGYVSLHNSSNIAINSSGTTSMLTLENDGSGGTFITDTGALGVDIASTGAVSGYGIQISDSSPSSIGIQLRVTSANNNSSTTGVIIENDSPGANAGITLNNTAGGGGLAILDNTATGIFVEETSSGGITIKDTGSGGVTLDTSSGTGPLTINTNNTGKVVINSVTAPITQTIGSGQTALGTTIIGSGAKSSILTISVTGVLTTDNVAADFASDPSGVTGYAPSANGMLTIIKWCSAGAVNFYQYNNTGASITPSAININWRVTR